jgi:hypothetical protein
MPASPLKPCPNTTSRRTGLCSSKGRDNGYVLNLAASGSISRGDTEETPELKNLPNIDIAFIR